MARKKEKTPKLRPKKTPDGTVKSGDYSLSVLLKGELDGRLSVKKRADQLEAQLIGYIGGVEGLTPPLTILIKKICHKQLLTAQREKMALLGTCELDKSYLAMANSLRLDILAMEQLLANNKRKNQVPTIQEIIEAESKEK